MSDDRTRSHVPTRSTSADPADADERGGSSATMEMGAAEAAEDAAVAAAIESADTAPADAVEDPEYSSQNPSGALAAQALGARAADAPLVRRRRAAGMGELMRLSWPIMLSQ